MGKVKDTSYFVVQGWMLNQLHLKGNTLQVFAIIHGFSHSEDNEYKGSLQYLCEFTGASRSTVIRSLTELQERGYIDKREAYENGVKFNRYKSSVDMSTYFNTTGVKMTPPPCQNDTTPHVKMTPHNIELNNISPNGDIYRGGDSDFGKGDTVNSCETVNETPAEPVPARAASTRKKFIPPSLDEVTAYCNERHNGINPATFIDYYEARGWKYGTGKPMVNWKAAVRTWEQKDKEQAGTQADQSLKAKKEANARAFAELFGGETT